MNEITWHWLPSRIVPSLSALLPKYVKWCHGITCCHVTWQSEPAQVNSSENHFFQFSDLDLWPMTFKLIQRSTPPPNFWSVGVGERWQTDAHTQTHWGDWFYTHDHWRMREWVIIDLVALVKVLEIPITQAPNGDQFSFVYWEPKCWGTKCTIGA